MTARNLHRRRFLQLLGLGSAAALPWWRSGAAEPVFRNWHWTRIGPDETADGIAVRLAEMRSAGLTDIILPGPDAVTCAAAAAAGLRAHAWWWTLCRRDDELMSEHADWYAVSRAGKSTHSDPPYVGYYRFLCPTRAATRQWLAGQLDRTLAVDGIAGACLDYVRYPDVILPRGLWEKYDLMQDEELPPFDFCYCDACRDEFMAGGGGDPRRMDDPAADPAWRRFRWDSVTRLVNELAVVARQRGKEITASVFPSPEIARRLVRQDWTAWDLDAVLPMVYHGFYDEPVAWIEGVVAAGVAALPPDRPLYPALYLPDLQDEAAFTEAVAAARRGGARGIALFGGVRPIPSP